MRKSKTRAMIIKAATATQTNILLVLCTRYISIQLEGRTPTRRCDFPKYVGVTLSVNLPPLMNQLHLTWSYSFSNYIRSRADNLVCRHARYKVNCVPRLLRQFTFRLSFRADEPTFTGNSLIHSKNFGIKTSKVSRVGLNATTWSSYVK